MRVLLSTYGTRGDVQPFVALAKALKAGGHHVALCAPTGFRGMIERHGVPYAHMDNAVLELTEAVLRATTGAFWGQAVLRAGVGPAPVPQKSLTAERLADAIRAALAPVVAAEAKAMGERIRAEDGTARAVHLIEQGHAAWSAHALRRGSLFR